MSFIEEKDLSIPEIQDAFLEFVEDFHAQHGYESDFVKVSESLGIRIFYSQQDQSFNLGEEKVILVNPSCVSSRLAFTGWHELSHHLFKQANGGDLEAYLHECTYNDIDQRYAVEEDLCFKAAARLLMPTPVVLKIKRQLGFSPLAVFELADQTGASLQAAMRRLGWIQKLDAHMLLSNTDGYVISSCGYGKREKYSIGYQFQLNPEHPLLTRPFAPLVEERFEAIVPFKSSSTIWKSKVVAAANVDSSKVLAFFLSQYPHHNIHQGELF